MEFNAKNKYHQFKLIEFSYLKELVGSCFAFELYKKIKSGGFKSLHPVIIPVFNGGCGE